MEYRFLTFAKTFAVDKIDISGLKPDGIPEGWGGLFTIQGQPTGVISSVLSIIISISGTIFIILLIFGGFMYLIGAGDEEKTGKAKKLMIDAVIGLVLTLAAWAIGDFVIGKLK